MAVLDTNFLIALETNDDGAHAWLERHRDEEHFVPDFVAVEYLSGVRAPDDALELLDAAFTIAHGTNGWIETGVHYRIALRPKA